MVDNTLRYSDADLAEFKELIINKINKAQYDLELIKSSLLQQLHLNLVLARCSLIFLASSLYCSWRSTLLSS